ncbi:MAG: hypothetical protein ACYTXA_17365 [Nostoc sp.]
MPNTSLREAAPTTPLSTSQYKCPMLQYLGLAEKKRKYCQIKLYRVLEAKKCKIIDLRCLKPLHFTRNNGVIFRIKQPNLDFSIPLTPRLNF